MVLIVAESKSHKDRHMFLRPGPNSILPLFMKNINDFSFARLNSIIVINSSTFVFCDNIVLRDSMDSDAVGM